MRAERVSAREPCPALPSPAQLHKPRFKPLLFFMQKKQELDSSPPPRQPGKPPDPGRPVQPGLSKSRTTDTFRSEQKLPGRSPSTISLKESKSRTDFKEEHKSSMMPGFLSEVNPLSAVSSVVNKFNPFDLISDSEASQEEATKKQRTAQKDQGKPEGVTKPPSQQSPKPVPKQQGPARDSVQQEGSPQSVPSQQAEKVKSQPPGAGTPAQGPLPPPQTDQAKSPLQCDAAKLQAKPSDPGWGEAAKPLQHSLSKLTVQLAGPGKPPAQQPGPEKSQPGPAKPALQQPGLAKALGPQPGIVKHPAQQLGTPKSTAQQPAPQSPAKTLGPTKTPAQPGPGKTPVQQPGPAKPPAQQPGPAKPSSQQPGLPKPQAQQPGRGKPAAQHPGPGKPLAQQSSKPVTGKPPQPPPTSPSVTQIPVQDSSKTICPLCNTTELLLHVPEKANFNTCTECQTTVCSLCGFNPNPHLTESELSFSSSLIFAAESPSRTHWYSRGLAWLRLFCSSTFMTGCAELGCGAVTEDVGSCMNPMAAGFSESVLASGDT
ncbi:Protein piccolo [Heterocephalus glaber]|uniref:Protein piccolo n=1 Tax=Heterocephalus glaber TaxID=10181 RepID=G5B0R6_HETGA|nr:Protein piccolo [Heterocephalus glaber]